MSKKFFPITLILVSLILFFYVFYRSEIFWEGSKRDYYFNYYLITISLFLLSILTIKFKFLHNVYFKILCMSFIFALYVSETYYTFFYNDFILKQKAKIFYENTGLEYDFRSKHEIYKDLLKNQDITVSVAPSNFITQEDKNFLAFAGISNKKTIFCNENGYYSIYESDRYGFNNPDKEWDKKNIEYLILGDSFAHGACVNRPNDLASNLRKITNKSILNLGYSGTSTLTQLAILREYYNSNINNIILFFYQNDIEELSHELKNPILLKYKNDKNFSQDLKFKQNQIDKLHSEAIISNENLKINFLSFIKLKNFRTHVFNDLILEKKLDEISIKNFENIFQEIIKFSDSNNAKLIFVYLDGYSKDILLKRAIKKTIKKMNIDFIDVAEEMDKKNIDFKSIFPFELPGHYNDYGYKIISEIVLNKIN